MAFGHLNRLMVLWLELDEVVVIVGGLDCEQGSLVDAFWKLRYYHVLVHCHLQYVAGIRRAQQTIVLINSQAGAGKRQVHLSEG
jgi:hypothetical protein